MSILTKPEDYALCARCHGTLVYAKGKRRNEFLTCVKCTEKHTQQVANPRYRRATVEDDSALGPDDGPESTLP